MNPIKGTEILFEKDGIWYNQNSDGVIIPTNTYEYNKRYQKVNALVIVEDKEDNDYLSSLNGDHITVITDKYLINRPDLKSFEFTKEWMSLKHYLLLRKHTAAFCHVAKNFNVPEKK
jgi:hypothetical protein